MKIQSKEGVSKVYAIYSLELGRAPTTKAVGSEYVTNRRVNPSV